MTTDKTTQPEAQPQWRPIETAPSDVIVVVAWFESDGTPHYDFDHKEDDCWQRWHDHAEWVEVVGGHGVSYTPPYECWMPLPAAPSAQAEPQKPSLMCQKCGVDRLKAACPKGHSAALTGDCPMVAKAQAEQGGTT